MKNELTSMQKYEKMHSFAERAIERNGGAVRKSLVCGCINCGNIFLAEKAIFPHIADEEHDTTLCPNCMCDAVIPDSLGMPINKRSLALLERAFYHYHDDDAEYQKRLGEIDEAMHKAFSEGDKLPETGEASAKLLDKDEDIVITEYEHIPKTTAEEVFIEAMLAKRWDVVLKLVEFGVKPGKVRHTDVADNLSALGLALEAGEYEVAEKLYEAGDRLDDYCRHEGPDVKFSPLALIAVWRRSGRDLFYNERASLSECCRKGLLLQAKSLLANSSLKELDRAAAALLNDGLLASVFSFGYAETIKFLPRIFRRGGRLSVRARDEFLEGLEQLEKAPKSAWWRIDDESAAELRNLVMKYTSRTPGTGKGE